MTELSADMMMMHQSIDLPSWALFFTLDVNISVQTSRASVIHVAKSQDTNIRDGSDNPHFLGRLLTYYNSATQLHSYDYYIIILLRNNNAIHITEANISLMLQ